MENKSDEDANLNGWSNDKSLYFKRHLSKTKKCITKTIHIHTHTANLLKEGQGSCSPSGGQVSAQLVPRGVKLQTKRAKTRAEI